MSYKVSVKKQTDLFSSIKFWILTLLLIIIYSAFIIAQNVVYVDPTNSGDPGQNGSIDHPYDEWNDFSIQSNTTYLQKKGTVYIPNNASVISINGLNNVTIGSYGSGTKPVFFDQNNNTDNMIDIAPASTNITIDDIELHGNGSGVGVHLYGSTNTSVQPIKHVHINNCDIHSFNTGTWYIPYDTPYENQAEDFQLVNCNIYDIETDGVFWVEIADIRIEGCHIYNVAQVYNSGGDGIQIVEGCPNYLIKDNFIDRSGSEGKFCFLHGVNATWEGTTGRITGNTFISPDSDELGGAAVYLAVHDWVIVDHNKFLEGGECAIYTQYEEVVDISYNLFYNIAGSGVIEAQTSLKIHNNTIVSDRTGYWFLFNVGGDGICQYWNNIEASNDMDWGEGVRMAYGNWDVRNNLIKTTNPSTWQTYFGFVDLDDGDLHLTGNSLAKDAGYTYSGYNYDIDSISVPQSSFRDVGGYEYPMGGQTNNPPVIVDQSFSINENAANGTLVGMIVATDPDAGQTLIYSITGGNTNNAFAINPGTGALSVNNSSILNYEASPAFNLIIQVQDNGQGSLISQATVTVNLTDINENPNISNQIFFIDEFSPIGTQVGLIVASDPDEGQLLTYNLLSGNIENAFSLSQETGLLTVGNQNALDYDINPSFYLVVEVTDDGNGNLTNQALITINLNELASDGGIEHNNLSCNVFPNPAKDIINVKVKNFETGITTISIMDLSGTTIIIKEFLEKDSQLSKQIDIERLNKGLYLISIQNTDKLIFEKFIKL
jgi:hypothetical protein